MPKTHDGRKVRLMTLIDEFTREWLAIRVLYKKPVNKRGNPFRSGELSD
jgi:hypothetical protein